MTRLETFADAAFAFAVTLLVVTNMRGKLLVGHAARC